MLARALLPVERTKLPVEHRPGTSIHEGHGAFFYALKLVCEVRFQWTASGARW